MLHLARFLATGFAPFLSRVSRFDSRRLDYYTKTLDEPADQLVRRSRYIEILMYTAILFGGFWWRRGGVTIRASGSRFEDHGFDSQQFRFHSNIFRHVFHTRVICFIKQYALSVCFIVCVGMTCHRLPVFKIYIYADLALFTNSLEEQNTERSLTCDSSCMQIFATYKWNNKTNAEKYRKLCREHKR